MYTYVKRKPGMYSVKAYTHKHYNLKAYGHERFLIIVVHRLYAVWQYFFIGEKHFWNLGKIQCPWSIRSAYGLALSKIVNIVTHIYNAYCEWETIHSIFCLFVLFSVGSEHFVRLCSTCYSCCGASSRRRSVCRQINTEWNCIHYTYKHPGLSTALSIRKVPRWNSIQ